MRHPPLSVFSRRDKAFCALCEAFAARYYVILPSGLMRQVRMLVHTKHILILWRPPGANCSKICDGGAIILPEYSACARLFEIDVFSCALSPPPPENFLIVGTAHLLGAFGCLMHACSRVSFHNPGSALVCLSCFTAQSSNGLQSVLLSIWHGLHRYSTLSFPQR